MENIFSNYKIYYLLLIILIMIIINIILNRGKISSSYKYLINGVTLILVALITEYYNEIINTIFNLKYLSVKLYMVIVIIINIITIYTINKKINKTYKIINYLLFSIISIILGIVLVIVLGTNLNLLDQTISEYNTLLLNISIIIFVIYLVIISIIYIFKFIFKKKEDILVKSITSKSNYIKQKPIQVTTIGGLLTKEELLSITNKELFKINGVECSIIFEDSIPDNIVKNYHILVNDINAKLVNGYTLEENILLKSICTKLKTNDLNNIDINNLSILNKISIEEYNFLKQIIN